MTLALIDDGILLELIVNLDAVSITNLLSTSKRFWCDRNKKRILERIEPYRLFFKYKQWNKGLLYATSKSNVPQVVFFVEVKGADAIQQGLEEASRQGNKTLINYFIQLGAAGWDDALEEVVRAGHRHLIDFFVQKQKGLDNWFWPMYAAIDGGHTDLAHFFLEKLGMKDSKSIWNTALEISSERVNREFIDLFIQLGADDWDAALVSAASGGHLDLVEFFTKKGANSFQQALNAACHKNHKHIIDFIEHGDVKLDEGPKNCFCLFYAALGGHQDLVDKFINRPGISLNWALRGASAGGHKALVELFLQKGANRYDKALCKAAAGGHRDIAEMLIDKGASNWNEAMVEAVSSGYRDLVALFIEKGANNWDEGLHAACQGGYLGLVKLFLSKGATIDAALMEKISSGHFQNIKDFMQASKRQAKRMQNLLRKKKKNKPPKRTKTE